MAKLSEVLKQATVVLAARGEGVLLFDENDRRYLDFTAGIGVTSCCASLILRMAASLPVRLVRA